LPPAIRRKACFRPLYDEKIVSSGQPNAWWQPEEASVITGMHAVIYTRDAERDRAFFRDMLGMAAVDAGDGWLIFAAPPSEVAFHPAEANGKHELFLTCDDVEAEIARLRRAGVECAAVSDQGWGRLTTIRLPGGGGLGLYQPRHPLAHAAGNLDVPPART
jgi:catechol 2,3-dioxygenase-like lactoylglutathione lyase family enzyme